MTRNPVYSFFQTPGTLAPIFLRLTVAVIFFYHGSQKAFGWFGGEGFVATLEVLTDTQSFGLSAVLATAAIASELAIVPLLFLGIFTRLAAVAVVILMVGAIYFVHGGGPFADLQLPLLVMASGFALLFTGGGYLSIDRRICRGLLPDVGNGIGYRPLSY